jgi:2-oxoglutarate ferredoxin oxidoreductase subunit alpha
MNNWMSDPFEYPTEPIRRGKVLSKEDLDKLGSFARYKDVDGDGVGYRTLPGTDHPAAAYFTRGSGHNERAQYSERPDDYVNNMDRLNKKFETARSFVPKPEAVFNSGARVGTIAFGTSHWAMLESHDQLAKEYGIETDYLRLKAYPFTREVIEFIDRHDRVYVVEQNRDAQVASLLRSVVPGALAERLIPVPHYNGTPIAAENIVRSILVHESLRTGLDGAAAEPTDGQEHDDVSTE